MLTARIDEPAATGVPLKFSVPVAGSVRIFTARKALAGLSFTSPKPKSVVVKL